MITVTKSHRKRVTTGVGRADTEGLFLLLWRSQLPWDSHIAPWELGLLLHSTSTGLLLGISGLQEHVCHSFIDFSFIPHQGLSRTQKLRDTVINEEAKPAAEREDRRAG